MESSGRPEIIEVLGRAVQNGWRMEAEKMPNPPDAWLRTYDEVSPKMQKTDKLIGINVIKEVVAYGVEHQLSADEFLRMLIKVAKNGEEEVRF